MVRFMLPFMLLYGILTAAVAQEFDLSWYSIDGGGAMRSIGGAFELSGTIGQPDAGTMSAGSFELVGGFWFQIPPSDCNDDGAVNLFDHGSFTDCLTGPASSTRTDCKCYDVNRDGAVDLQDFAAGQNLFLGS